MTEPTTPSTWGIMVKPQFEWNTYGDPVLKKMAAAASEFVAGVRQGGGGWISFVGNSGNGKTYLAEEVSRRLGGTKKYWPGFMSKMRSPDIDRHGSVVYLTNHDACLLLDEIGVGNDNKDFGLDLLMQVLEGRRSRPTILTSNLTLNGLAAIDARIASRMVRNGTVVECDTIDYALRGSR